MGELNLPIAILFTKIDKPKQGELIKSQKKFKEKLLETWEEMPPFFITSAEKKVGRDEVLQFIENAIETGQ